MKSIGRRQYAFFLVFIVLSALVLLAITRAASQQQIFEAEGAELSSSALLVDDETASNNQSIVFTTKEVVSTDGNSIETIIYDMYGEPYRTDSFGFSGGPWPKHEGPIELNSGYDWYPGARPNPNWNNTQGNEYIASWCQVIQQEGGAGENNFRVSLRNHKTYALVGDTWQLVESSAESGTGGALYDRDFMGAGSVNARAEDGGVSQAWTNGLIYHPWINAWPRNMRPSGTRAMFTTAEMRLVPDSNPNVNLDAVKVLGSCGIDYYPGPTATAAIAPGAGIARHKYLTADWKSFNFITLPEQTPSTGADIESAIRNNPPPLD